MNANLLAASSGKIGSKKTTASLPFGQVRETITAALCRGLFDVMFLVLDVPFSEALKESPKAKLLSDSGFGGSFKWVDRELNVATRYGLSALPL
jgi:hypothetical protein